MASGVDYSNWNIIYPTYLDKDSTTSQGRKISQSIAVSKPTLEEIKSVLEHLNVPHVVEARKRYPRNWLIPGRIRVFLGDPSTLSSGSSTSSATPTVVKTRSKKQLLNEVATLISQLKSRQASSTAKPSEKASPTSKKKAGKKKR